jgi:hypothetical protein
MIAEETVIAVLQKLAGANSLVGRVRIPSADAEAS